jgi:hypothetical protein
VLAEPACMPGKMMRPIENGADGDTGRLCHPGRGHG